MLAVLTPQFLKPTGILLTKSRKKKSGVSSTLHIKTVNKGKMILHSYDC